MTRKEKIQEAAEHYEQVDATNLACDYGWGERDIQQQCFKAGVEWADQHPRKGLWDSDKVVKWLENNLEKFGCFNCFIEDHKVEPDIIKSLREAMEG